MSSSLCKIYWLVFLFLLRERSILGLIYGATTEMNRFSADGNPTLCTSVVVPGGLPRAIPVSAIPKIHTERENR
jgi:hypothetical protein